MSIIDLADRPSEGEGFVRTETIQQAVALVSHPEVNVYQSNWTTQWGPTTPNRDRAKDDLDLARCLCRSVHVEFSVIDGGVSEGCVGTPDPTDGRKPNFNHSSLRSAHT